MVRDVWREKRLFLAVCLLLLVNIAATLAPAEAGQRLVKLLESGQYGKILPLAALLLGIVLVKTGSDFLRHFFAGYLGHRITANTQRALHEKFLALPSSYFKNRDSGEILSRTTNDVQEMRQFLSWHLPDFVKNPLIIAGGLVALFLKNWLFTLEILGVGLLIVLVTQLIGSGIRKAADRVRRSLGVLTIRLQQTLLSMDVIKVFTREKFHRKRFNRELDNYLKHSKRETVLASAIGPLNEFFSSLAAVAVVGTGIWLISSKAMQTSELIGFILYLAVLSSPLNALSYITVQYRKASASVERIQEILDAAEEENRIEMADMPEIDGRVEFRSVHFAYKKKEPVLRGISFTADPGSMTAIVGPSGCGKTTLVNMLPGLIEPDRGRILIDGRDCSGVNLPSLRRQIGMVTQESVLFNDTIMENIRYGRLDATDGEVIQAAKEANAHGFIKNFKNGYTTIAGERGDAPLRGTASAAGHRPGDPS